MLHRVLLGSTPLVALIVDIHNQLEIQLHVNFFLVLDVKRVTVDFSVEKTIF